MINKSLFTSDKQNWETPQSLFEILNDEFNFEVDLCADNSNYKCDKYFTQDDDALSQDWGEFSSCFCNPPYESNTQNKFVEKAHDTFLEHGNTIVLLIPARTDTKRWHKYIFGIAEVRFLEGRLKFECDGEPHANPAPFPSAVVVFGGNESHVQGESNA